jgi:predicted RNA binding protein YcfA (HicA-like mRNA interferase family)
VTAMTYGQRMNSHRLLDRILRGDVANIAFRDLIQLLLDLGFLESGGRGSHRVFTRLGVRELVNLQNENGDAKHYQVRQVANIVRRYNLKLEESS